MNVNDYLSFGYSLTELSQVLNISRWRFYKYPHLLTENILPDIPKNSVYRWIESSLLGDGSIVRFGDKACYSHSSSNLEYLTFVRNSLSSLGLPCGPIGYHILTREKSGFKKDCNQFYFKSHRSKDLFHLRVKWYNPVKEVPKDFQFSKQDIIRIFNEDGSTYGKSQVIFWGVKSDDSFFRFVDVVKQFYSVLSFDKRHKTGGRMILLNGVETLPGYSYKFK